MLRFMEKGDLEVQQIYIVHILGDKSLYDATLLATLKQRFNVVSLN